MKFTIIGASGFIGSALTVKLIDEEKKVFTPSRNDDSIFTQPLGHVIYAAGVTADFRSRPFETFRANTSLVADLLEKSDFDSFLYLSSARIYRHTINSHEDTPIPLQSHNLEDLYDLTKLTSEALCHASSRNHVRIVRLTNVVGSDFRSQNFLFDLIRSACDEKKVNLRTSLESAKDYVLLRDVVDVLPRIAVSGSHSCYNHGSGLNLTHGDLLRPIIEATGAELIIQQGAQCISSPLINIDRLCDEFAYQPSPVLPYIPELINEYRRFTNA
jgi:nucleoside-diphosphate-sugar epimerase